MTMAQPRVHLGSHSSANRFASAICAGVILAPTSLAKFDRHGERWRARNGEVEPHAGHDGVPRHPVAVFIHQAKVSLRQGELPGLRKRERTEREGSTRQDCSSIPPHEVPAAQPANTRLGSPAWVAKSHGLISIFGRDRDPTLADRFDEGAIVAKVLVGVFNRELAHRVIERRIGAHVTGDPRGVAGPRMGPRQRPGAELAQFPQRRDVPVLHYC